MENFHQSFKYTFLDLSDFIEFSFRLQGMNFFFVDKCIKMKFLIYIYALFYSDF